MSTTLANVRQRVRHVLHDYPNLDTTDGQITATATTLIVDNVARFSPGNIIQIGTEVLKVESLVVGTRTLTIQRGYMASTAAIHTDASVVYIFNRGGFTDLELNQYINDGIDGIIPELYYITNQAVAAVSSTAVSIDVSSYLTTAPFSTRLLQIWWRKASQTTDEYKPFRDWTLMKDRVYLSAPFGESVDLILVLQKYETRKTADADVFLIVDEAIEAVVLFAVAKAYRILLSDRNKFTEYSAVVDERAGSPTDIINMARDMERRAYSIKRQHSRTAPVTWRRRIMKF